MEELMSDFDKKVATARASLVILLEQALSALGGRFVELGEKIRSEDKDAETRADYLNSAEANAVWGTVHNCEAIRLRRVLDEFDDIELNSASAPVRYTLYMEQDKYQRGAEPNKLEHIIGGPAILTKYLIKAGYKLEVEPSSGIKFVIVISRL